MTVFLALPAYNEEASLPLVLAAFHRAMTQAQLPCRVVIVDDGSTDGTQAAMREWSGKMNVDLVVHPVNLGLGETIRDALKHAAGLAEDDDVVVSMDADNTHSPDLIPPMIERIREGYDLVIASRYRKGSAVVGLSLARHLMSYGARFLFQATFPIRGVRDYTCAFRAYRGSLLHEAFAAYGPSLVTERGFSSMAEILLKMAKLNLKVYEVPMVLRYDLKGGASKMNVGLTASRTLKMILRNRF